jgi:hypothetical protein
MWMREPLGLPRGALALATSMLLVLLVDRADKARRTQLSVLLPLAAGWPAGRRTFEAPAQWLAAAPGLIVLAVLWLLGLAPGAWTHASGRWYLALACTAQLLLVAVPSFSARGRVGVVALAILLLTATGGEIWN